MANDMSRKPPRWNVRTRAIATIIAVASASCLTSVAVQLADEVSEVVKVVLDEGQGPPDLGRCGPA